MDSNTNVIASRGNNQGLFTIFLDFGRLPILTRYEKDNQFSVPLPVLFVIKNPPTTELTENFLQSLEPPFLVGGCPSISPVHLRAVRFCLGYFFPKFLDTL